MMIRQNRPPLISVIIPTFNRAELLKLSLESLTQQTIVRDQYETIVIDDGSTDTTVEVCKSYASKMRLTYYSIQKSGTSSAKNLGIFTSRGKLVLFFDDDDVADRRLLEQHLQTHERNPQEHVAVLGYTTWSPMLKITPVMDYIVNVGQILFSYGGLKDKQVLDFSFFWAGRTSCKRSFVAKHGIFSQQLAHLEDVELGYRLSRHGLKILHDRSAISYMTRPITYDEFCRRCEKQGEGMFSFNRLHTDPLVQQYCSIVAGADGKWEGIKQTLGDKALRVRQIEKLLASQTGLDERDTLLRELRSLYERTFTAFKLKGIVESSHSNVMRRYG